MRILLTILPVFWPKMPPMALGYLQSYLQSKAIDADILDLNNIFYNLADEKLKKEWLISCNTVLEKNILSIIKNDYLQGYNDSVNKILGYDVLGFSCFKSNFFTTLEIIKELKARKKKIKIILGGPEITRQYFRDLGRGKGRGREKPDLEITSVADFLVVGEGEQPLFDYLRGKNKVKVVKFEQLKSLEDLPFPNYRGLNLSDYPRKDAIPLQFSRGCVRRCKFCSERLLYQGFRARRVEDLIQEIRYHRDKNKINYFIFFDSLINADLKKLEEFCDKVIDAFGKINWEAQIAIRRDMPDRLFEKIKRSGCYNLFVGLESGSDKTLAKMNKGFTAENALDFFKQLNRAGLFFGISMIIGYPKETGLDFKESLDFVIRNKDLIPKIEQVNPFTYYDGTKINPKADYKINKNSKQRMEIFVRAIKKRNFKYTNAFLGNLIEK